MMKNQEMTDKIKQLLTGFLGNEKAVQVWLNQPRDDLGGKTPQGLIASGRGEVILDMLEAALAGVTM